MKRWQDCKQVAMPFWRWGQMADASFIARTRQIMAATRQHGKNTAGGA